MDYAKHLSLYKIALFQKEITSLFSVQYNIHKISNLDSLVQMENVSQHISCMYCLKCRICQVPCKHVMAYILKGIMVELGEVNKEKVYTTFLEELDDLLMNKFFASKKEG